jgi:hypothetical protein
MPPPPRFYRERELTPALTRLPVDLRVQTSGSISFIVFGVSALP